jgi:hypothetical protein
MVAGGRKSKIDPEVLLRVIAGDYVEAARPDDSVSFLERLFRLEDPR